MVDRAQVLAYAQRHGPKAAAAKFHIPVGTVWSWRARERRRAAREAADRERADTRVSSPAQEYEDRAAQLAGWVATGACLQCGGAGRVQVPPVTRGDLVIRRGRVITCPTCGGQPRQVQVTEWPAREWAEAMRRAGDLGAGWNGEEWQRIHETGAAPDGSRFTSGDRLEPGGTSA